MSGHPPPKISQFPRPKMQEIGRRNRSLTLDEKIDEIKQAYVDDIIGPYELERDLEFVLTGGVFAGTYTGYIEKGR